MTLILKLQVCTSNRTLLTLLRFTKQVLKSSNIRLIANRPTNLNLFSNGKLLLLTLILSLTWLNKSSHLKSLTMSLYFFWKLKDQQKHLNTYKKPNKIVKSCLKKRIAPESMLFISQLVST
jgi:hypothetical protein